MSNIEPVEPAKVQKTIQSEDARRLPLVSSEKNNVLTSTSKHRVREVNSRYMTGLSATPLVTPATQRRCPSPIASTKSSLTVAVLPKRPQSAERGRPAAPTLRSHAPLTAKSRPSSPSLEPNRSATPDRDVTRQMHVYGPQQLNNKKADGVRHTVRNLSSSFQSYPSMLPPSKKEMVANSAKVITEPSECVLPLRRSPKKSDQSENCKPLENSNRRAIDRHLWPMLSSRVTGSMMSESVNSTDKISASTSAVLLRGVSPKSPTSRYSIPSKSHEKSLSGVARRLAIDGSERPQNVERSSSATRSIRALSLDKIEHDVKLGAAVLQPQRSSSTSRPVRAQSSVVQNIRHPSSPVKSLSTSSTISRSLLNPSRTRPSTPVPSFHSATNRVSVTSPAKNFLVDVQKGKKDTNYIEDVHLLRILRNVELQWHFANAQADNTLMIQAIRAENVLHTVSNIISNMHDSVILRRISVQILQREIKISNILKKQIAYLELWEELEGEHLNSLSRAIQALQACTLRVPVTGIARADIVALKDSICSALDVLQTMVSFICSLVLEVEDAKALLYELSAVSAKEKFMLEDCRELLGLAGALQIQEASLRTYLIQLRDHAR